MFEDTEKICTEVFSDFQNNIIATNENDGFKALEPNFTLIGENGSTVEFDIDIFMEEDATSFFDSLPEVSDCLDKIVGACVGMGFTYSTSIGEYEDNSLFASYNCYSVLHMMIDWESDEEPSACMRASTYCDDGVFRETDELDFPLPVMQCCNKLQLFTNLILMYYQEQSEE